MLTLHAASSNPFCVQQLSLNNAHSLDCILWAVLSLTNLEGFVPQRKPCELVNRRSVNPRDPELHVNTASSNGRGANSCLLHFLLRACSGFRKRAGTFARAPPALKLRFPRPYRDTSLIRKRTPLGPCRRPMPRVLGGCAIS